MLAPTLDAIPLLRSGRRGRPRRRPDKLHADKAYDARARRQECRARGIVPRIARGGIESSEKLGRHRWVVERTHAWFNRFRRLPVRYERRADIYEAFTSLAASLITLTNQTVLLGALKPLVFVSVPRGINVFAGLDGNAQAMSQRLNTKRWLSLSLSIKAMAVVVGLGIPIFVTSSLYWEYGEDLRAAEVTTANTSRALEQHAARTIERVDTYLQAVVSLVGSGTESLSSEIIHKALRDKLVQSDYLTNILVLNTKGEALHEAVASPARLTDRSKHDYLVKLRDEPHAGLFVGQPILGRHSGLSILPIARRINHLDGSFAGVIVATLKTAVFQSVFETFDLGPDSTFSLWRSDGTLLVRAPHVPALIGRNYAATENYKRYIAPRDTRPFWSLGSTDGINRVLALGFVPSYPLYVSATQSRETALIGWHKTAWNQGGLAGGLTLVVVLALLALARELTQRRRSEHFLLESEGRYRLLADAATDMIVLTDLEGTRRYVSPASRELLGYDPQELVGTQVVAMGHPDDADRLAGIFASLRVGSIEQASSINRLRRKDGSYVWVEAKLKLVRGEVTGEPSSIICAVRDVSERHSQADELRTAKEAAEAASAAKGEFLASMSHELRTPLNAIIGFSGLMVEGRDVAMPTMQRYARLVQDASTTLLSIVNDVLDVSKLEAGDFELDPHPFSPRELIESSAALLRDQASAKGLVLHVETDSRVPERLLGDEARLRQVLLNLLSNAVKFTAKGMVWLFVACEGQADGQAQIRFTVMDTGIGIPLDKRHRLFKRFSQVDGSTARKFGGSGLGLSICKSLVGLMGGDIAVDSVEGEGTAFSFVLSLPVTEAITAPEQDLPASPARSVQTAHILLAEDVVLNQELAVAMLTKWGHTVDVVSDGATAVDAVTRTQYDLVLMDVQMPVMDGIEAMHRIRGLGGAFTTLPIIAMTANVMARDIELCLSAGADGHIGKPFAPEKFRAIVERWTDAQASQSQDNEAVLLQTHGHDRATLDDLQDLVGPQATISILGKFVADLDHRVIEEPHTMSGWPDISKDAHALVSTAGLLGFSRLSEACRTLEQICASVTFDEKTAQAQLRFVCSEVAWARTKAEGMRLQLAGPQAA